MTDLVALAALADAVQVGRITARLFFPFAGVVLVIAGILLRVRARAATKPPPGYYQQPQYPYAPPAPPPPSPDKRKGSVLLVVGALLIGVALVGAVERVARQNDALAVGNCGTAVGQSPDDFQPVDCDDPAAVVEVASRSDTNTCPDGKQAGTRDSDYGNISNGSTAYCFLPNLKEGSCYTVDMAKDELKPADCNSDLAVLVAKRVDGSTDESVCAASSKALVYTTPARVYCLTKS